MSRRVLLICYYFPPLGLGGVGRPLNLFKRLEHHWWECDVLTVKPVLYRAYEPELLKGLDASRIHRSGSRDPQRLLYLLGKRSIESSTISRGKPVADRFFPDSKVGWVGPAVRLGSRLLKKRRYDFLISTAPPISCHLVGMKLHEKFKVPWIADFRDFWTIYKLEDLYRGTPNLKRARALLDRITATATKVTTVNRSIAEYLKTGETITNGYDPDIARHWRREPDRSRFTIGLLGHQHDSRQIEPLLNVLKAVIAKNPGLTERIRILQVGQIDPDWFRSLVREHGLDIELDLRLRQPREATVQILSDAHVFYYGISEREGSGFLPGRSFELIASGRPILAYVPVAGELSWLLEPVPNALCFSDRTLKQAADFVVEQAGAVAEDRYSFDPLSDYARQFSAEEIVRRFAQLMERLV